MGLPFALAISEVLIHSHKRRTRAKFSVSNHAATMIATNNRMIPSWIMGLAANSFDMFAPASGL